MNNPTTPAQIAERLTDCERDLLLGRVSGWGSWMWSAGSHMVSLGLGTKRLGSIDFDTPLGLAVRVHLLNQEHPYDK